MESNGLSIEAVRGLVMRYGWNSTAYQILNPGMEHWRPALGQGAGGVEGVVGFVRRAGLMGRAWVAAGAPVCERKALLGMTRRFEEAAAGDECRVCYFCAGSRLQQELAAGGRHAVVAIGVQPVWDPRGWEQIVRRRSGIRAQLNRARNKGVVVERWQPEEARDDARVRGCLEAWIAARPMPAMRFMVEPYTLLGVLRDRVVLVGRRGGEVVGFLVASPVPRRNGYLVEQIVRAPDSPNGTAELLIDGAMRELAAGGNAYVTLGLVALASRAQELMAQNPLWLRVLMGWARAHGRRFYHFDGLEAFRAKLFPMEWEPVYAISNEKHFSTGTLYAIAEAFCDSRPWRMGSIAVGRAVRQEAAWAGSWLRGALAGRRNA